MLTPLRRIRRLRDVPDGSPALIDRYRRTLRWLPVLFHNEKGTQGQGVDAGAVEAADGFARVGDQWLAE
jgi:hypothetical protein